MPRYVIRYGIMRGLAVATMRGNDRLLRGARVLARTPRGMEAAEVLCEATDSVVAQMPNPVFGQVVREMNPQDELELTHVLSEDRRSFETCQRLIAELGLQMQLVDVEHLFGGERVVVYYLAEQRVDFRDLVKRLASDFQTRVEMRQIGVRDEAKLLADYGDCGKPVCCNTHLFEMPPVSMKMAKVQKATLDPTKISGRCGRLKCCLRYEYDTYEAIQKDLPPVGSEILTRNGRAIVVGQEILSEQLLVETEDRRRILIPAADVLTVVQRGKGRIRRASSQEDDSGDGPNRGGRDPSQRGGNRAQDTIDSKGRPPRRGDRDRDASKRARTEEDLPDENLPGNELAEPNQADALRDDEEWDGDN
jgi:cell fate regulator YaaT (PSP1 superfamily)